MCVVVDVVVVVVAVVVGVVVDVVVVVVGVVVVAVVVVVGVVVVVVVVCCTAAACDWFGQVVLLIHIFLHKEREVFLFNTCLVILFSLLSFSILQSLQAVKAPL